MELTHEYIKFEKKNELLLWFIKADADILLINSTFINSQGNKVRIISKSAHRLKIRCPSGDYEYTKKQVLDYLKSGKYSDFTFYYNTDSINPLLIPIFNYYRNFTITSITYQNFISFYKTNSSNFLYKFLEKLVQEVNFDLKNIFDDYFDINKKVDFKNINWKSLNLEDWLKYTKSLNLNLKQLISHVNNKTHFENVYSKLEGKLLGHKAEILYKKWNNKPNIKKWDVGTYVVFLKDIDKYYGKKGNIDIIEDSESYPTTVILKNYLALSKSREINNYIKWFATKAEAEKFSRELLNNTHSTNKSNGHEWNIQKTNYISDYLNEKPFENRFYPITPDECYKKSFKLNRKLLLL